MIEILQDGNFVQPIGNVWNDCNMALLPVGTDLFQRFSDLGNGTYRVTFMAANPSDNAAHLVFAVQQEYGISVNQLMSLGLAKEVVLPAHSGFVPVSLTFTVADPGFAVNELYFSNSYDRPESAIANSVNPAGTVIELAQVSLTSVDPVLSLAAHGGEFRVNTATAGDQTVPAVAQLTNGGFVVTWTDASVTGIKAQVYDATGAKVGAEFLVNTSSAGEQDRPAVAGLADGGFIVTWHDFGVPNGDIKARTFAADGTAQGAEITVNAGEASGTSQRWPAIAVLSNGNYVVAWEDWNTAYDSSGRRDIVAQMFAFDGTALGTRFRVNANDGTDQAWPKLAALANGGFVATWQQSDAAPGVSDFGHVNVVAQVFDANGAKAGAQVVVGQSTFGDQANASVVGLVGGGFAISWTDTQGTEQSWSADCFAQVYTATGIAVGDQIAVSAVPGTNEWSEGLTALADGGFVISWKGAMPGDASWHAVGARAYSAEGTPLGDAFRVSTATANDQHISALATLASGQVVAVWQDHSLTGGDASGAAIKAQMFDALTGGNAAPVIASNGGGASAEIALSENRAAVTTVAATDGNADTLTYSITGGADAALFSINAATGALRFVTAPNYEAPRDAGGNNVYDVTVGVSDGTATTTQALAVSIRNVNEAPTGSVRVTGSAVAGATLTATHTVSDPDGSGTGHFQWTRDGVAISSATRATYTLVQADLGHAIAASLVYTDGGGFAQTVASAAVTAAAADPGVTIAGSDHTTGEDGDTAVFSITLNKAPVDAVTLNFTLTDPTEGTLSTRSLTFTAANWNVAQALTVTGADDYLDDGTQIHALHTTLTTTDLSYTRVTVGDVALSNLDDGKDTPVQLYGSNVIDYLVGGNGDDRLYGGGNMDDLRGGIGNDRLYGQEDDDRLYGGDGADWLYGGYDDDQLYGQAGADRLLGESGNDRLEGGAGNDVLDGGEGADTMVGGAGNDTYYVDDAADVIDDQGLASDVDTVLVLATIQYTLAANVENAALGKDSGDAGLSGNAKANDLDGNDGANALAGGSGNDSLDGGAGADVLDGGSGNDVLVGGLGTDTADYAAETGAMVVDLAAGTATGDGADTLSGVENVAVGDGNDAVTGSADANLLDGGAGNDNLAGGGGDDVLIGGTGADTLYAGDGNDSVDAGAGNDLIIGGNGAGNDRYDGGSGTDTVKYTSAIAAILVDLSAASDQAKSRGSADAGIGVDQLAGIENVIGGNYGDMLVGNAAANRLCGRGGNDVLTGKGGADTFVFDTAAGSASRDTITDFSHAQGDRIVLSRAAFNAFAATGTLADAQFHAGAGVIAAHDADDRIVYNTTTGALYYDADGAGGAAAVQFATIGQSTHAALVAADLLIAA
ncbi:MAG: hypothetical protein RIS94_1854 [Pseudomonadota bacterium]